MSNNLSQLSQQARFFVQHRDWAKVNDLANQIKSSFNAEPEGYFLAGLANKAARRFLHAAAEFEKALSLRSQRYDAAIELAQLYVWLLRHGEACNLLNRYEQALSSSPLYLDMAAQVYSILGLHEQAWPLYEKANQLQPDIDQFQVNLAKCAILLGSVHQAKSIYINLVNKYPLHQKNHYELSKLETVKNTDHIEQMRGILSRSQKQPEKNIYLYYALGKELEDLGHWQESFAYYKRAGDAVLKSAQYDVNNDIRLINTIIDTCSANWLIQKPDREIENSEPQPIFVVGLPRTGTTLVERILSSHSKVESADETFFMQMAIRQTAGVGGISELDESIIRKATSADINTVAENYMKTIAYRLSGSPMFIDKYPYNYLYLGFIAKAFPQARIVYLRRNPMDTCFALYKQSFFKFAYSLDDLGAYYVAQNKLRQHWCDILGNRIIEVEYETLVNHQETETRSLLCKLGLDFEKSCIQFEQNRAPSATASTLQIREKIHSRSVNKWKNFESELFPLKMFLSQSGIKIDE